MSSFTPQPNLLRYPPRTVDWSLENAYRRPRVSEDAHVFREGGTSPHSSNSRDRTNSVGRVIDFEGLKDVPVGPKSINLNQDELQDTEEAMQSPHIFISARDLPVLAKIEMHLKGLLKSLGSRRIRRDHSGWYLIYERTPTGRQALERCHREYHMRFLFNEYQLNMKKFPRGVSGQAGGISKPGFTSSYQDQEGISPSQAPPTSGLKRSKDQETSNPNFLRENQVARDGSPRLEEHDSSIRVANSQPQHRHTPVLQMDRRGTQDLPSSQLSLRSEHDDTASLASAVTRSDSVRRSTRDACHVCKQKPVPGYPDLAQCSTCKRKYHGRCHKEPPIPAILSNDHAWSCRRCVRKRMNINTAVPSSDPAPFRSESHTSPPQIRAEGLCGSSNDVVSAAGDAPTTDTPKAPASDEICDSKMQSIEPSHESFTELPSIAGKEAESLSDTDLLVAQSFAAAEEMVNANDNASNSGKLKFTRTKLLPSMSKSFDETRQPQPENTKKRVVANEQLREHTRQPQPENTKENFVANEQSRERTGQPHPENTNEKDVANGQSREHTPQTVNNGQSSARSSAADLRAYAQRRHQSEIAKSIEPNSLSVQNQVDDATPTGEPTSNGMSSSTKMSSRSSSGGRGLPTQIAPHAGSRLEVPESPEESRKGGEEKFNASKGLQAPSAQRDSRERLSSDTLKGASRSSLTARSGPAKGPRGLRTVECQECGKKIAQVPSGKNKLCTFCKKKAGAPRKAATTEKAPSPSESTRGADMQPAAERRAQTPEDDRMDIDEDQTASDLLAAGIEACDIVGMQKGGNKAEGTPEPAALSSDDEPLSKRRRRYEQLSNAEHGYLPQQTPSRVNMQQAQPAVQGATDPSTAPTRGNDDGSFIRSTAPKRPGLVTLSVQGLRKFSGHDFSADNNQGKPKGTVTSLFDEWPEFRDEESFDPEEKLAEIRKRPTRKQMFGKPASHSRLGRQEDRTSIPMNPTLASREKRSRTLFDANNPYPWEDPDIDPTRKECKTLEEFWDYPANMLPIISDGHLAYRDGTRNEDGRLPRAREIFKP